MNFIGRFCLGLMLTILMSTTPGVPEWAAALFIVLMGIFASFGGEVK